MKKLIYTLAFIFVSHLVLAQSTTENYVKTTTYQVKTTDGTTKAEGSAPLQDEDKIQSITYIDGMGRPYQSVTKKGGGQRQDIVVPIIYDKLGRQTKEFLPYANESQSFGLATLGVRDQSVLLADIENYYATKYVEDQLSSTTINAYSEKRFESSPLNRVLEQGAPGKDWIVKDTLDTDHTIKFEYHTNTLDTINPTNHDNVRLFDVTHPTESGFINGNPEKANLVYIGYYNSGELYKTITKDENWQPSSLKNHTTEEFKNKLGQVVLKRTYDNNAAHDTYYVYDDFGNLTFVISPEGSKEILDSNNNIKQTVLDELCYQYNYDYRNRLVEKKIPQKGLEYIVYDRLDRPVLTQDSILKLDDKWLFTKYDNLDRVAYTGIMDSTTSRDSLQTLVNSLSVQSETRTLLPESIDNTDVYYNNLAYPIVNISKILTINYYDDYNWDTDDKYEADYDLIVSSGLTWNQQENTVYNFVGGNWHHGFTTEETIEGDGYIQWTMKQNDKTVVIGLSEPQNAINHHYNTIDYAIFLRSNGTISVYEAGAYQYTPTIYYSVDDTFKVQRTGNQVTYFKNNIAFHSSTNYITEELIGDGCFGNPSSSSTATIKDIFIGYSKLGQPLTPFTKGLSTGSKIRTLTTDDWTTNTNYYDQKARPIYSISRNDYLSTIDANSSYFDFSGKVIKSHSTHSSKNIAAPIVTKDEFRYDHTGRLLRQEQRINADNKQLISRNTYDELGQLKQKQVGGSLPNYSNLGVETNIIVENNVIKKNANSNWNNSGASTASSITGDGYVSFTPLKSGVHGAASCGLSYTDTNAHWNTIDYAIHLRGDGNVTIKESGDDKGDKTTFVPGDIFTVERRETTIFYIKNGQTFYVSDQETTSAPMIGDLTIYSSIGEIKDFVLVDLEQELQEVDYTYNIRGWLKTINDIDSLSISGSPDDLFGFKLNYNTNDLSGTPLFNGNISETLWNTASVDPNNQEYQIKRGYDYTYDALNRIESADFHKLSGVNHDDYFNLNTISYDRNGNILTLARSGVNDSGTLLSTMDNLTYTYQGNQLTDVLESGDHSYGFKDVGNIQTGDYVYDANGNMTTDHNKDITITYNHLNLPVTVTQTGGGIITYTYDATGVKLSKSATESSNTTITEYANNFIYKDASLEFFSHPEGYIKDNGSGGFDYVFQYKDHLGNIRLSYSDSDHDGLIDVSKNEIIEENNYYPFGLEHKGYNNVVTSTNPALKRKFNGIELEESLGVDWYEMDVRQYDPSIARWTSIDPVTHYDMSTYNGYDNNPVYWADPSGADTLSLVQDLTASTADGTDANYTNNNDGTYSGDNGAVVSCSDCKSYYLNLKTGTVDLIAGDAELFTKGKLWVGKSDANVGEIEDLLTAMGFSYSKIGGLKVDTTEAYNEFVQFHNNHVLALTKDLAWEFGLVYGLNMLFPTRASYGTTAAKTGFSALGYASKFGIKPYKELTKLTKGKGLEVHHLIEKRFASTLGVTPGSMQSIALTKAEHAVFTRAWLSQIGRINSRSLINTGTATKDQIYQAARSIYKDFPEILNALGL